MIPYPIPYQGSKRRLASLMMRYLPARFNRLVEPFSGSAAFSMALACRDAGKTFWLNDADTALMALWHEILFNAAHLGARYAKL